MELTLQLEEESLKLFRLTSRNPYFIGINSAIRRKENTKNPKSTVAILILLELTLQFGDRIMCNSTNTVAILILLELTLQFGKV